ncbi:MAG: hypothetical protein JXA50_09165 [Deltaproteobacteria bacterium]|nr:hypothetical protein [Deltaproteobacteria bacterium]
MRKLWQKVMLRVGPSAAFFLIKFLQITMRIEEVNGEGVRGFWERVKMSSVPFGTGGF